MIVQPVIDRLKASTSLRQVQGALELAAALKAQSVATPAAFVVPMVDRAKPDEGFTGSVLQLVTSTVAIVLVLDNKRDSTGAAANPDLERYRQEVRTALLGWVAEGMEAPITAGEGHLIDIDNGRAWWADEYHTEHYWSSEQ